MDENGGNIVPQAEISLQSVIRARKAECKLEAEQNRQADLQRIRDMRSTTGINPLQLFPNEVWSMILQELNAEDRGNIWEVHPKFRDLMGDTRVRDILFPKAIQVNALNRWLNVYTYGSFKTERLRCVSKSLRNSFDNWLDNNLKRAIQGEEDIDANVIVWCRDRNGHLVPDSGSNLVKLVLGESEQLLERLLVSFQGENCAKRFFRRGFSVYFRQESESTLEVISQFREGITTLLEKIGDQIWYFKFVIDHQLEVDFPFSQAYILFSGWISLMPNLKWLEIDFDTAQDEGNVETNALFRRNPFPWIESLERITFALNTEHHKMEIFQMFGAILEANHHIKMLDLDGGLSNSKKCLTSLPVPFIQSLQLSKFRLRCEKITLQAIQPILNFNWQLTTMTLELEKWRSRSLTSLFRLLERFPTLENVKLKISGKMRIDTDDQHGYLNLPHLTNFEVIIAKPKVDYTSAIYFFFSLDFLLQCKKLKTLKWSMHDFDDVKLREHLVKMECPWEIIDFRAGLRFLYESNLWNVFPSLKTVSVVFKRQNSGDENPCNQEYQRGIRGDGFSVGDFLKGHNCCRFNCLQNCAILFG